MQVLFGYFWIYVLSFQVFCVSSSLRRWYTGFLTLEPNPCYSIWWWSESGKISANVNLKFLIQKSVKIKNTEAIGLTLYNLSLCHAAFYSSYSIIKIKKNFKCKLLVEIILFSSLYFANLRAHRRDGKERKIKMIKMWYIYVLIPHDECAYYVSQTYNNKVQISTFISYIRSMKLHNSCFVSHKCIFYCY